MGRRLTQEEFIKRSMAVHGDRYDYSEVVYIGSCIKVKIKCKIHGVYEQTPNEHCNKRHGCRQCSIEDRAKRAKISQVEFIERSKKAHGDQYDYSISNYIDNRTHVDIICKTHGVFKQMPQSHWIGFGCVKCGKKTSTQLINEFIAVHGSKYDYSLVDYKNSSIKVKILCHKHGVFAQYANNHLNGSGCPECGVFARAKKRTKSVEYYISKAISVHGNRYGYSLIHLDFVNYNSDVKIYCKKHGVFIQKISNHVSGNGCPECGIDRIRLANGQSQSEFINKAISIHGDKYIYDKVTYINSSQKVTITCKLHGDFKQTPNSHLIGNGCRMCSSELLSNDYKKSSNWFVKKAKEVHGDRYKYDSCNYDGYLKSVNIICKKHGKFKQSAGNHLSGKGCPRCKTSKGENKIRDFLTHQNIAFIDQRPVKGMHRKYYIDFLLPDYNLFIEYHGKQHYKRIPHFHRKKSDFQRQLTRDQKLRDLCTQRGIDLLEIGYFDFDRIEEILSEKLLGVKVKRSKQLKLQL